MVACGAQARNAYCQAHNLCSANGNAIVAYADSLVQSVNNHELSEAGSRAQVDRVSGGSCRGPATNSCGASRGEGGVVDNLQQGRK